MSYLTDETLEVELERLIEARYGPNAPSMTTLQEYKPERVRFLVGMDRLMLEFSIPEDDLQNCPLSYISETYLLPMLKRAERMKGGPRR